MNTARELLSAALREHLPEGVRVMDYALQLDALERDARIVMLRLDGVEPSPMPQAWRRYRYALVLAVAGSEPGRSDDTLDQLVEDVLDALEATRLVGWSSANRAVLTDSENRPKWPSYEVVLTLDTRKTDPNA